MANDCFYEMKAVARNREALERLMRIMKYDDPEYFLYRVFDASFDEEPKQDKDGSWSAKISGCVAWGCSEWFNGNEDFTCPSTKGYEQDEKGRPLYDRPIKGTAHFTSLDKVCGYLGIAVELWSQEPMMCFQQHGLISVDGTVDDFSKMEWRCREYNDDGEELDEPFEEGGFENYGKYMTNEQLLDDSGDSDED